MGSMEHDEVIRRLDRMIKKAEAKGQSKNRLALILAKDSVLNDHIWAAYGDCNTCGDQILCGMCPQWGGQVRRNCPHYKGPKKVEEWRGER